MYCNAIWLLLGYEYMKQTTHQNGVTLDVYTVQRRRRRRAIFRD